MARHTTWKRALFAAALAAGGITLGGCSDASKSSSDPHAGPDRGGATESGRVNNSQPEESFVWNAEHLGVPAGAAKDPATASRQQHGDLPEGTHRAAATGQDVAEVRARMLEDQPPAAQVRTRNELAALGEGRGTLPTSVSNDTPTPQQPAVGGSGQPAPAQPLPGVGQPAQGEATGGATSQGQGASGATEEGTMGGHGAGVSGGPAQTVGGAGTAPRPDTQAAEPHEDEAQQVQEDAKDQDEAQQQ